jgi:hypothetical protein
MVQLALPTAGRRAPLSFQFAHGFGTRALAYMLDSLVRVSRRVDWIHFLSIMASHFFLSPSQGTTHRFKTQDPAEAELCYLPARDFPRNELMLRYTTGRILPQYWSQSLPFWHFQALLTLFSKFFASFPHGTCSLSVSCCYLALDGIYHPLRAALASNPTRRERAVQTASRAHTGISPSMFHRSR